MVSENSPLDPAATSVDLTVDDSFAGQRADQVVAALLDGWSRSALQQCFKDGDVRMDGRVVRQKDRVFGGESISVRLPTAVASEDWVAQPVAVDVVYEDNDVTVVNKPAGLVVHPGAGNRDGTLVNGLLYRDKSLATLARAGIVHRLDKDTTGLMVCARNEAARLKLVEQLSGRTVHRQYVCVVAGDPGAQDIIDQPIGRSRTDRTRMAVTGAGKPAITEFQVTQNYRFHSLLKVQLKTGRTHQIRVHMAWYGHPLLGDRQYGQRRRLPRTASEEVVAATAQFDRQALHAAQLGFNHPATGKACQFGAPVPDDMAALIAVLHEDRRQEGENLDSAIT